MKINPEIRERIIAAANFLATEGNDTPTNDQVREKMGGGSAGRHPLCQSGS